MLVPCSQTDMIQGKKWKNDRTLVGLVCLLWKLNVELKPSQTVRMLKAGSHFVSTCNFYSAEVQSL